MYTESESEQPKAVSKSNVPPAHGLLDVGDLVSASVNNKLEAATDLLDSKYRQAKYICTGTTAKLIHVPERCKCGQYQHSDVMQFKPPTFTITLLVCESFKLQI